jgi:hypothetical protein
MICDNENILSLVHTHDLNLKQVLQVGMSKYESLYGSFCLYMQSRRGNFSQLSRLRGEDVLSTAIFITSKLTNSGVCCIHLF